MLAEGLAERRRAVALASERHVDAPERERQRLAEVAHDDLQPRIGIEHAGEHQAYALRRRLHGEAPGR